MKLIATGLLVAIAILFAMLLPTTQLEAFANSTRFQLAKNETILSTSTSDDTVYSPLKKFRLLLMKDGTLAVVSTSKKDAPPVWKSTPKTPNAAIVAPFTVKFGALGHLMVVDKNNTIVWQSDAPKGVIAKVTDEGVLSIIDASENVVWIANEPAYNKVSNMYLSNGNDYESYDNTTADKCRQLCSATASCKGITMLGPKCTMKTRVDGKLTNGPNYVSYTKILV